MTCMQSDEVRFLILNRPEDWQRGWRERLEITDEGLRLRSGQSYTTGQVALTGRLDVTEFAVGACDQIFILDGVAPALWLYDPEQARSEAIDELRPILSSTTSLAYAPRTLFIGNADAEPRLAAVAESNWQILWTVSATEDAIGHPLGLAAPFHPIDLAVTDARQAYALDDVNKAVLTFDASGELIARLGEAELAATSPTGLALWQGALFVLDGAGRRVLRFSLDGTLLDDRWIDIDAQIAAGNLPPGFEPAAMAADGQGRLIIGDGRTLAPGEEDDRYLRLFAEDGDYAGVIAAYRGRAGKLIIDSSGRIYVFDRDLGAILILEPHETYLLPGAPPPPSGLFISDAFDSTEEDTAWHKVQIDGEFPEDTLIHVSYLTSNARRPLAEIAALPETAWSTAWVNPTDALFGQERGRYLWLRVRFLGTEHASPLVRSIRVMFPRVSYLRYLPAVYQQDEKSREFLERFLSIFETFFAGLEDAITHIPRLLDAAATSGDFLAWLATWLGIAVDQAWSDDQRRALIQAAPELYRKRGTRAGLEQMIEIYTGDRPLIVEKIHLGCEQTPELQALMARLYGTDPYCFCVLLKPFQVRTEDQREAVRRIIAQEKPAHTCAGLLALQPWIYLDMHTYLGINTHLSRPSPRLDTGAAMPRDTVLTDVDDAGQVERRSRLGMDTTLT